MIVNLVALFIGFAMQTAVLFGLVWVMIKLQHLDQHDGFHLLKVLGVVALACVLDMVPFVGHFLAVAALLGGLKKVTDSHITDVAFTVAISYALMFAINMFVIISLMGDFRPSAQETKYPGRVNYASREPAAVSAPEPTTATNRTVPTAAFHPTSSVPAKVMPASPDQWIIKGLSRNGAKSVVTIDTGVKAYTLFLGDAVKMQTADGTNAVRFEKLEADSITLNVDGKPVKLPAH
jgi:hypothetical protein